MGAQNVQICASNALIGVHPIPAQIGSACGYRPEGFARGGVTLPNRARR
jgi:hypothetical protein